MHLPPNTLLQGGKYRIERVLGQGGFGITYLATQVMLDRQVAIKEFFFREYCERNSDTSHVTLGTQSSRDLVECYRKKFVKEAQTISTLDHPNIIRIYDVFEENGTAYYVMDYVDGESLSQLVTRRGAIPQQEALSYIIPVANALSYIHIKNINHLDVKPGNILRRSIDGRIFLIDFGVAKQYDAQSNQGTTTTPVGISHGYSPAEQYRQGGVQQFSPQSDVYSLAATLYKLLTGETPPESILLPETGLSIGKLASHGVSQSVTNAILAAMRPRNQRTQSVGEFVNSISQASSVQSVVNNDVLIVKSPQLPQQQMPIHATQAPSFQRPIQTKTVLSNGASKAKEDTNKLSEKELIFFWEVIIFFVIILAVSIAVYNLF